MTSSHATQGIKRYILWTVSALIIYGEGSEAFSQLSQSTSRYPNLLRRNVRRFLTTESGLRYDEILVGEGPSPGAKDFVSVHYEGKFKNGKTFDSSRPKDDKRNRINKGKPVEFAFGRGKVIPGWEEGIKGMNVGGKVFLSISYH